MKETWQDIKDYEGKYQISCFGNIYSYHVKRTIIPEIDQNGYAYIRLWKSNKRKIFKIHRLVAIYFIPNCKNDIVVNHMDGNKLNNNASNLEWCTYSHNQKHAYRTKLRELPKGSINGNSKLHEIDIKNILNLFHNKVPVKDIAIIYNVTWECINNIKLNKSWKHVDRD
jgi:hypothetical protein